MFRRKTKSIHNLAHRLKNLQIKSKSDGPHLQTPVPVNILSVCHFTCLCCFKASFQKINIPLSAAINVKYYFKAPESPVMPNSPVYKNVDPITEEEPQGEAYENIDVTKGAQNRYGWHYTFFSLPL